MSSSPITRQAITALGASAGAPAGIFGALAGSSAGEAVGTSILGPAGGVVRSALTRQETEEEMRSRRASARRAEEIKLLQDRGGKSQTTLADTTSQSSFPFRLY